MRIAVLSGKGGTGKTLVSVNLAAAAGKAVYADCDVEEPNGHLFFRPDITGEREITVKMPAIDQNLCTGCRKCVDFCQFNALAYVKKQVLVFEEVCHSCGGCALLCPAGAITEREKPIGKIQRGRHGSVETLSGFLNTGEASGVPVIRAILQEIRQEQPLVLIDCPPGSACPVMESIKDADYCVLVAEPTLFGVHNLAMVWELVRLFQKPHGAVLNKCLPGENPAERFCTEKNIPILGRIPFDRELGARNAKGEILAEEASPYRALFASLLENIQKEAGHEAAVDTQR